MPTDKPRFTITLDPELVNRIDNYKFSHRMKNQNQAVISLIEKGFDSLFPMQPQTKNSPSPEGEEEPIITIEEMKVLLCRLGLIGVGDDLTDKDVSFVSGIFDLLQAWFSR